MTFKPDYLCDSPICAAVLTEQLEARKRDADENKRLRNAIRLDIEDANVTCGGDGLGCKAFRPYYDNPERRYRKCGQCPMDALSNVREVMSPPPTRAAPRRHRA